MRMPSVMSHNFSQVPQAEIQRSSFDRSHGHKTTFNAGKLVPIFVDEVLPGDTFDLDMSGFVRLTTPLFPLMDNMIIDTHFFFVPNRLVWGNWKKFCGEQLSPSDSTDYVIPKVNFTTPIGSGSLADYFGLPLNKTPQNINVLPFRAYYRIYNEWFRDQNLQTPYSWGSDVDDGPETNSGGGSLADRGKRHDYFTSCLPWPQKGDSVNLVFNGIVPVESNSLQPQFRNAQDAYASQSGLQAQYDSTIARNSLIMGGVNALSAVNARFGDETGLQVDLSQATVNTINELRMAFQVQKLLERDARGGTRYIELLKAHFGVTSPDARIQRSEYLGGGSTPIIFNPIAQTSETNTSPLGTLGAIATANLKGHGFTKSFTEHGYIIGIASVRADLTYQQGINKLWSRNTRWDFYWPALAHLGEQAVLNKEIFYSGTPATDDAVFGYQERFAEYRYKPSLVTGQFRSDHPYSLDSWHLSQDFATTPVLGHEFIRENPPMNRVLAVTENAPHFYFDSYFRLSCTRPMPVYSVPGFIDHF